MLVGTSEKPLNYFLLKQTPKIFNILADTIKIAETNSSPSELNNKINPLANPIPLQIYATITSFFLLVILDIMYKLQ